MGCRFLSRRRWYWLLRGRSQACDGQAKGEFNALSSCSPLQPNETSVMTISEVDALLDQLAAWSSWSQLSQIPIDRQSPSNILRRLYRDSRMSPLALAVLTQVILRDLRPLLCPLPKLAAGHPEHLIYEPITNAPEQLTLEMAMLSWDPFMAKLYWEGKGDIDWCATAAEAIQANSQTDVTPGPMLGINVKVAIPCIHGR